MKIKLKKGIKLERKGHQYKTIFNMTSKNMTKIVLVGDANVGKSVWLNRLRTGEWEPKYFPTMGVSVNGLSKKDHGFETSIWDCAGDRRYRGLAEGYYTGATGAIIMFDVHNPESFKSVNRWHNELTTMVPDIPIVLCGTKVDIQGESQWSVSQRMGEQKARKLGMKAFFLISAKSCYNFDDPLKTLLNQ